MNNTALAIACWNRPHYFQQLITSLETNLLDLENVDIHLFVDGDICAFTGERRSDKKPIHENISIFQKALLPNKFMHIRTLNVSVGIHQYQLMQMLTPIYERIIFIEDDVVVSPNFIGLIKKTLDKFEDNDEIFSISPGFRLLCKKNEVEQYKDAIKFSEGHFWVEAMWTRKWNKILPKFDQYMNIIKDRPYKDRDNQRIKKLFESGGRAMPATSQDNAKDWAISTSGMKRARFVVNRATGIGENGVHSTKDKLKKSGDGHNEIYVFDNEKELKLRLI